MHCVVAHEPRGLRFPLAAIMAVAIAYQCFQYFVLGGHGEIALPGKSHDTQAIIKERAQPSPRTCPALPTSCALVPAPVFKLLKGEREPGWLGCPAQR